MKTFREFILEVYDPEIQGRSQITKQGEGGRIGRKRKQTDAEKKRVRAVGGGKTAPAKNYKARKDIGTNKPRSKVEQQPTRERGSAALSAKEAQKKAYLERKKRSAPKDEVSGKDKKVDLKREADKLLTKKKKQQAHPDYKPQKASGYTRDERRKIKRAGQRLIKDMQKGKERPRSAYEPGMSIAMRDREKK